MRTTSATAWGLVAAGFLAAASLALLIQARRHVRPKPNEPWKIGYWLWAGDPGAASAVRPDVLYAEISGVHWPGNLPAAAEYIVVRRIEVSDKLDDARADEILQAYRALVNDASGRASIAGLQIDYDCPTSRLGSYGRFLTRLRDRLPAGASLSITALLDWFAPHTSIAAALRSVDEFVPQFYDTSRVRLSSGIATTIDTARWAPVFNALGVPYRIGVSSFGRVARIRTGSDGAAAVQFFRDASPLDFAGKPNLTRSMRLTPAGETSVRYDVMASMPTRSDVAAGDAVEVTFPTGASMRAAVDAARAFGGRSAGILFFRWPNRAETMVLAPDDVARVLAGEAIVPRIRLDVRDATCLERRCADLSLDLSGETASTDRVIAIRADHPFEVFLPEGPLRPIPTGSTRIDVRVPAYAGFGVIALGRAISRSPLHFEVVEP